MRCVAASSLRRSLLLLLWGWSAIRAHPTRLFAHRADGSGRGIHKGAGTAGPFRRRRGMERRGNGRRSNSDARDGMVRWALLLLLLLLLLLR